MLPHFFLLHFVLASSSPSFWSSLSSWGILSAASRAEMAYVVQMKKIVPSITCEITFGQNVCELMFGVNVCWIEIGVRGWNVWLNVCRRVSLSHHWLCWFCLVRNEILQSPKSRRSNGNPNRKPAATPCGFLHIQLLGTCSHCGTSVFKVSCNQNLEKPNLASPTLSSKTNDNIALVTARAMFTV